uniref:Nuclear receptor corepressor 1 n=3 Tax=Anthurium amnicola TaxID=1678845 RepID=A0A1D1XWG5_9ARAE
MPPEPSPWDRRDFVFREKKHDRGAPYSDALGGGGGGGSSSSTPRWREPCHAAREFPTPSPRRPPSGYYRHGGSGSGHHNLFPDEPCTRSEDDGFRTYQSGRHGGSSNRAGNSRDGGAYFRRSSWDSGDLPRQRHESVASQRSVADPLSHPSSHLIPFEDQHDKTGGGLDDGSRTGHKHDRDLNHSLGSLQWKPLKWNRSSSFSSSSKVVRSESDEGRLEVVLPPGKETPVESPAASPVPLDEGLPRKKQRLGWGQGLAKYEKQKFEGTDDGAGKNLLPQFGNSTKSSLSDASPKLVALPGSASPATPASAACSSSHGGEDKYFTKVANTDASITPSNSPSHDSQHCLENFSINSEHLDHSSLSDISSVLTDLLLPENACSIGSHFMRHTAMSKLLLLKDNILKQLEKTESEIDLFENELKKLNSECERNDASTLKMSSGYEGSDPCQRLSKMSVDYLLQSSGEHATANGPLCELIRAANDQGDSSLNAVESDSLDATLKGIEASDSVSLKAAVLETGSSALSDSDHLFPSISGNEQAAVCGVGSPPDVGTGSYDAYPAVNSALECCSLAAAIMALNRESAKRASEALDIPFRTISSQFQAVGSFDNLLDKQEDSRIRNKLAMHKRSLRFKERALAFKYRALQHMWKEDLRVLSMKKHRPKSQRRFELNFRSSQNGSQKNRSLRSRFVLSGSSTLVPTPEILDFTSKLLSDSQIKLYRNDLRMSALILDDREKKYSRFETNNGLIEDPCYFEKERSMINPWTPEEREIFMEMLALYGKDFTKIASFLGHKTTADCIEFYYKNHKSVSFEKVKKSLGLRKNHQVIPANSYLLTSGKKWKREMNAASLDVLGTASMIASQTDDNMRVQHKISGRSTFGSHDDIRIPHGTCAAFEMSGNVDILGQEQETSAADVLMGICGALSSEAMSSCVTTSFDHAEKMNYVAVDRRLASEVDEDICSDEGYGELDSVDWTDEEKSTFISALSSYGRDFARISLCLGTRSKEQCKIFFSKARKCLGLDSFLRGSLSDANIGKSDTDDACMFEIDSAICSTQSCSKMEVDFTHCTANDSSAVSGHSGDVLLQIDQETYKEQQEVGVSSQDKVKTMVEKLAPSLHDVTTVSPKKEENPCFTVVEGKAPMVDLRSNVSTQLDDPADIHTCRSREKAGNGLAEYPGKSISTDEVGRVDRMDSCASTQVLLNDSEKGLSGDCFRAEFETVVMPGPKTELHVKQQSEIHSQAEKITSSQFVSRTNANGSARLPADKVNACPVVFTSSYMQPLDLLPGLDEKPQFVLLEQKVNSSLMGSSFISQPLSVNFEDHSEAAAVNQSSFSFEDHGSKQQKSSSSTDIYQQYLTGKQFSACQSAPILIGYPLQSMNKKVMNGQAQTDSERSVLLRNCQKKSGSAQDSHGEHIDAQLMPCLLSGPKETEEQSVRTGDVKLFGQILSHPSPVQKPNSPARCNDHKPSNSSLASNLKLMNGHLDGTIPLSRAENCHQTRHEVSGRNYGIWGDHSIQRGLSAVSESGVFLAKCPGSSLSCYTVKDHPGSCGFVQQAYLQPLTLNRNRSDISLDLQKHNRLESVSGFQHQGRVSLGRTAGTNILVSKGCTGVSDPVAALKLHYAAQTGGLGSEEESWRADIGR